MSWNLSDVGNIAQILSPPLAILLWWFKREEFAKKWKKPKLRLLIFAGIPVYGIWYCGLLNVFFHRVEVPVWILIVGGVLVVAIISFGIWRLRDWVIERKDSRKGAMVSPNYRDYTHDKIFDVNWHWNYRGNVIDSPEAFCPVTDCQHRLEMKVNLGQSKGHYQPPEVYCSLHCPRCNFQKDYQWDERELLRRVSLEIERLINTGQFQQRLAAQSASNPVRS
jgi:hypothetical protein